MRLFLALNPPPELRLRLDELADIAHAHCGGRRVPTANLHLTLAFLGEVEEAKSRVLADWLRGLTITPGEWRLDAWGHFPRPGIVWVGGQQPDPMLTALHQQLWESLEARGVTGRSGHFVPHVTLVRQATQPDSQTLPPPPASRWTYDRIALMQSLTDHRGACYRTLAQSTPASNA
ncbi:RNA 2',3'-cyclic phosphodiesterase [Billgrantia gudaonensis]|uniref:RNA 2',3'-cyclic phosphodiesterase n=1 Tax=Billgrantia gudaonensis TaxID=376427 RepID=A0A1G8P8R7_9GAMM|nr:RNA 2',3'-cyclic phosphodiesterase [Halomonas gudaonensis]SDI88899.1 2'-5' RNA ligase [Halomonas gudaonensis]